MARGLKAGDVLVLVRQRGPLFEAIIRALKNAGVPVAGADRLVLTEHIAVMDLMALADALLLPDDDLALASVLKSPLFGLNEEQLFALGLGSQDVAARELARQARRCRLLPRPTTRSTTGATLARATDAVRLFRPCAGAVARAREILGRLGPEANDALDEFLNLALDYETPRDAVAAGFRRLAARRQERGEARHGDRARRVRVMTVHGAKGLEAPIVILADTTTPPERPGVIAVRGY